MKSTTPPCLSSVQPPAKPKGSGSAFLSLISLGGVSLSPQSTDSAISSNVHQPSVKRLGTETFYGSGQTMQSLPVQNLGPRFPVFDKSMKHALLFLILTSVAFAQTNIAVSNSVARTVKRAGINLGQNTYYGSQQFLGGPGGGSLFSDGNPGFQNALYSTVLPCNVSTSSTTCVTSESNSYTTGWFGAYITQLVVMTGPAAQCNAQITNYQSSTPAGFDPDHSTFTFTPLTGTSPVTGQPCSSFGSTSGTTGTDYIWLRKTITAANSGGSYQPAQSWGTLTGGSQFYINVNDAPAGPTAFNNYTNSLRMGTTVTGDVAQITNYDDTAISQIGLRNFYDLNGNYTVQFDTKLVSGSTPGIVFTIYRANTTQTRFTTTVTPTGSWVHSSFTFNAGETGNQPGYLYLTAATNGTPQTVEIANVQVNEVGTDGNTTPFRNAVVSSLRTLHPDIIRMWDGATGNTSPLDNMLYDVFKRQPVSFTSFTPYPGYFNTVSYSIPDFLQLCQAVGSEPWIVIPVTWNTTEISHFIDYLSGESDTTYGAIRIGQGFTTPWTSVFSKIHLELGNEQWNNTFTGGVMAYNPPAYGTLANQLFQAAKANNNYVPTKMDLILGGQFAGVYYLQQIQNNSNYNDSFDVGPYLYNYVVDFSSPNYWQGLLGEPQKIFDPVGTATCMENANYSFEIGAIYGCPTEGAYSIAGPGGTYTHQYGGGTMAQIEQAMANTSHPVPIKYYEMGINGVGFWPGSPAQSNLNTSLPSLGTGLFAAQEVLQSMSNGITDMNWFQFGQDYTTDIGYYLMWGIIEDAGGPTNGRRPPYWALSMVNDAVNANGASMLATTVTGSPRYNVGSPSATLPYSSGSNVNGFAANGIDYVTAHAFQNGSRVGLVLMNLSPTSQAVNFSGANAPSGAVTVTTLTSTYITDDNETNTATVVPVTSSLTSPTSYTLPPYSEVEMTWNGSAPCTSCSSSPVISAVGTAALSTNSATIAWTTDQPSSSQVEYGTTASYGSLSAANSSLVTAHSVPLTGLAPGTTYQLAAMSTNAGGGAATSPNFTFTTPTGAPVISGVSAGGLSATSATISWTTDQPSSSQVEYGATANYGSLSTANPSLVTAHSVALTGLTPGTTYQLAAMSTNAGGGAATSSNFTFSTPPVGAPVISAVSAGGLSATSATVSWTTDQPSSSQVRYGTTTSYGSSSLLNSSLTTSHSVTLTGLTAGTTYDFVVSSTNSGGTSATSANATFGTANTPPPPPPANPPYVGYVAFWGINNSGITVSWSTDVPANTQLAYGTTSALGQLSPLQTAMTASHGVVLTGLATGTTYYFAAMSTSANGATGQSKTYRFTTTGMPSPPLGPAISSVAATNITGTSATITWTTDRAATALVKYGLTNAYGSSSPATSTLQTSQSVGLTGLTPGTTYDYQAVSADSTGPSTASANYTFTTPGATVGRAPDISYVVAWGIGNSQATVTWSTDIAATTQLAYGVTTALGQLSPLQAAFNTTHAVTLTGLSSGTTYYFVAQSANSSGMVGNSSTVSFKTTGSSSPTISGILVVPGSNDTAQASWTTSVPTNSYVQFGPTTNYNRWSTRTDLTTNPKPNMGWVPSGLTHYQLVSTDANGVQTISPDYTFVEP